MMKTPRPRNESRISIVLAVSAGLIGAGLDCHGDDRFTPVALKSRIPRGQPMTGIVLWTTSEHKSTEAVQLEYSYMKYGDVVTGRDQYDWGVMDRLLDDVASRKHQAIIRFYFVYP